MSELVLKTLHLRNFRAFADVEIEFDPRLTVLMGSNGSGKSAALSAISVMLSPWLRGMGLGAGELRGFRRRDARRVVPARSSSHPSLTAPETYPVIGEASGTWRRDRATGVAKGWHAVRELRSEQGKTTWGRDGSLERWSRGLRSDISDPENSVVLPIICCYGTSRLWTNHTNLKRFPVSRTSSYAHAFSSGSDLNRQMNWLRGQFYEAQRSSALGHVSALAEQRIEAVRIVLSRVMKVTGWTNLEYSFTDDVVVMRHNRFGALPLWMLSDGIRLMAGLAIDLTIRLCRANPHLGGRELLEQAGGICMIDEIDQHLHPEWQQVVVQALTSAFPAVQFVLTTHSPQVLSTVAPHQIRDLETDGSGAVRASGVKHSRGLRSDVVLKRLMDTDPEPDTPERRQLRKYMKLVYEGDGASPAAERLRTSLAASMGGVENVPEFADADAHMALQEYLD